MNPPPWPVDCLFDETVYNSRGEAALYAALGHIDEGAHGLPALFRWGDEQMRIHRHLPLCHGEEIVKLTTRVKL